MAWRYEWVVVLIPLPLTGMETCAGAQARKARASFNSFTPHGDGNDMVMMPTATQVIGFNSFTPHGDGNTN